jgi:hypothetical protein
MAVCVCGPICVYMCCVFGGVCQCACEVVCVSYVACIQLIVFQGEYGVLCHCMWGWPVCKVMCVCMGLFLHVGGVWESGCGFGAERGLVEVGAMCSPGHNRI